MIVSIGLGDEGVNVCLDDEIGEYNPIRTVELCNAARRLFFEAYTDTLVPVAAEPEGEDDAVE